MPLWSVQEWRARIGSSYCALGVWTPTKLRGTRSPLSNNEKQCARSSPYTCPSLGLTCSLFFVSLMTIISSWNDPLSLSMVCLRWKSWLIRISSSLKCVTLLLSYFKLLLLLCGDIETNPGPDLTVKELLQDLAPVSSKWIEIGIQLGIDVNQLRSILQSVLQQGAQPDDMYLFEKMLGFWSDGSAKVVLSQENVIKLLRTPLVDEKELSDQLQVKYGLLEEGEHMPNSEILEEALKSGYVTIRITKVLVTGSAGNGKTHTKYFLFNELKKLKEIRKSTPLFDDPIRAISREFVGTSQKGWHKVTYDELNKMLAASISEGSITHNKIIDQIETEHPPAVETEPPKEVDTQTQPIKLDVKPVNVETQTDKGRDVGIAKPSLARQKMLGFLEQGKKLEQVLYLHWIHFIDSGGQPQFIELLPAFVKNTSVVMIVLKLPESLYEYPKIEYYDQQTGRLRGTNYVSHLRNDQIIQHCARTLSKEEHSQVMVVGTHRDAFEAREELMASIEEKNLWLVENLKHTLGPKLFSYKPPLDILYPLNAKDPQNEDFDVASKIREDIESGKEKHPPYKIPIAWFLLEQDMQKLDKSVITLDECHKLALSLHMTKVKVNAALEYLHKLNIILYYPRILKNIVFVNPQVIVDKITELVAFSFELRAKSESEGVDKQWNRYINFGEIEFKMLNEGHFLKHYIRDVFSPAELVKVFIKLLIMARVTDPDAPIRNSIYFMPSLLQEIAAEVLEDYRPKDAPLAPAVFYFKDGCAPCGTFPRLSVYLISHCGWKRTDTLYRNCIKFCLPDEPAEVTVIDAFDRLEVYLTESPKCPGVAFRICRRILKQIKSGLKEAFETLGHDNVPYSDAVMCPHQGQGDCKSTPHAATVNDTAQYCICTENPKVYGELHRKHSAWFTQTIPLPGVQFISQSLLVVAKSDELQTLHWKKHGLKIHVPPGALSKHDTQCEFTVGTSLSGSFKFPEKHTLVSPIYYIQPSKKFKKPITIELEHWCSLKTEDDTKALVPIFAQSSTKNPPYTFKPLRRGNFSSSSNWGTFNVTTFSLFGLSWSLLLGPSRVGFLKQPEATPTVRKKPPVLYSGWIYYRPNSAMLDWFLIKLIVTPRMKECVEAVKQEYTQGGWTLMRKITFCFSEDSTIISLDITEAGVTTDNGWIIEPCSRRQISEQFILESKQDVSADIASCELSAQWKRPNETPATMPNLCYKVNLKGVESDCSSFLITISPNSSTTGNLSSATSSQLQGTGCEAGNDAKPQALSERHHLKIRKYLKPLEKTDMILLGQALGLGRSKLKKMDHLPDDMIDAWLNQEDDVMEESGPPTWESLCTALRDIDQPGIASNIGKGTYGR